MAIDAIRRSRSGVATGVSGPAQPLAPASPPLARIIHERSEDATRATPILRQIVRQRAQHYLP
jgi:hypothetical protein